MSHADLLSVAWDNDLLTGSDRGYTNGLMISYLTDPIQNHEAHSSGLVGTAANTLGALPGVSSPGQQQALAFSLRQLMVTPANIAATPPDTNDLPYAGFLSASATLWSWNTDTITGYGVHLGVIGPESGAAASQKWVHKLTGSQKPRGWDSQLGTDVIGGIQGAHGRKLIQYGSSDELQQELSLVGSATLSSFRTSLRFGTVWRTGHNLPVNFLPDYASSSSTIGLPGALDSNGPGWSVFIGLGLEAVPYSYLDKNSGRYRFEESLFQGHAGIGATMLWEKLQLSLILRATTGEEETNKENFTFGSLSAIWAL
ncbi:lipid A deacylase LpxR family protein [Marinobacter sp. F3R08]|uniref:lipid A deacylase LpxR family protein n=1 Tax=Marinobacter sp. F3R08 TaxID=2841559 RepID=UPI001E4C57D0|nr:lipid A deacylase LpxR family protein [Marinobacter sp. F3R08]